MKAYLYPEGGEEGKEDGGPGGQSGGCQQGGAVKKGPKELPWMFGNVFLLPQEGTSLTGSQGSPGRYSVCTYRSRSSLGMFRGDWDQIGAGYVELHHARALLSLSVQLHCPVQIVHSTQSFVDSHIRWATRG